MREFDPEIARLEGRVAVVSFATPDHVRRFAQSLGHPYLWLADPGRELYRGLGLGRRGWGAVAPWRVIRRHVGFALQGRIWHPEQIDLGQMGGDYVFDARGRLFLEHPSQASDDRPPASEVMRALRAAAAAGAAA